MAWRKRAESADLQKDALAGVLAKFVEAYGHIQGHAPNCVCGPCEVWEEARVILANAPICGCTVGSHFPDCKFARTSPTDRPCCVEAYARGHAIGLAHRVAEKPKIERERCHVVMASDFVCGEYLPCKSHPVIDKQLSTSRTERPHCPRCHRPSLFPLGPDGLCVHCDPIPKKES